MADLMTGRRALLLALVLPLVAIVGGIVRAELHFARSRDFVFEIGGYDPRDLLRGRFLQFRLRVELATAREQCPDDAGEECCLCLTARAEGLAPEAARARCTTARDQCDGALLARYLDESLRYYVPELEAAKLDEELASAVQHHAAHVVLAVDREGRAQVRALRLFEREIPGAVR